MRPRPPPAGTPAPGIAASAACGRLAAAAGMSLVELMVAVLILCLMTVLGWRALDGIVRSRAALAAQLDTLRGHQLAFAQMEADCARLVRSAAFDGQPTLSASPGKLILLRAVTSDGGPDQLQIVMYHGDGDNLVRSTSPMTRDLDQLHAAWQAAQSGTARFHGVALDRQVAAFELQTWRGSWRGSTGASGASVVAAGASGMSGAAGAPSRRPRTRRIVQAPAVEASGLQIILHPVESSGTLVRMFMLGAG